jgi:DNA-binding NarL/FixJ family response regulator
MLADARLLMLDGDADHPVHDWSQYLPAVYAFLDEHARPRVHVPNLAVRTFGEPLTAREVEVLSLLSGGHSAREIADHLTVSVSTVQRHIANIYKKIGARGRVDAAAYGIARGIVRGRELEP